MNKVEGMNMIKQHPHSPKLEPSSGCAPTHSLSPFPIPASTCLPPAFHCNEVVFYCTACPGGCGQRWFPGANAHLWVFFYLLR